MFGWSKISVLDTIKDQVGTCVHDDEYIMGIIRAGSAVLGLRKRHAGHVAACCQTTTSNLTSQIYSAYPDQGHDGKSKETSGSNFQTLWEVTSVRFKKKYANPSG